MTRTVTASWQLPTTRRDGGPLPADEISHSIVEMSSDGGVTFDSLGQIPATEPQLITANDLAFGVYWFRVSFVDTADRAGDAYEESVDVVDDSPPAAITDITFTVA
jgi:hypothetical protein